jgi:hypothetical protein
LAALVGRIVLAVPARARTTFLELLLGAAATKSGHVTDAILTSGASRSWTTYFWFLERGRWSWLQVWDALLGLLPGVFTPAVWHVVLDDSLVERVSTRAPGSMVHHNHTAKPNRPRFLRGQGWLCLAAVLERDFKVGAVPLMLRLVRRGANRGKLKSARFLLRLLGQRLGQVRVLLDAWFMRGWLIQCVRPESCRSPHPPDDPQGPMRECPVREPCPPKCCYSDMRRSNPTCEAPGTTATIWEHQSGGGLSRWPKVLQQASPPEPLRGHGSLATRLLWPQRQDPGGGIGGQGVDRPGLPIGRGEPLELAPELIHRAQLGRLLGQPQEPDAQRSGQRLGLRGGVGARPIGQQPDPAGAAAYST